MDKREAITLARKYASVVANELRPDKIVLYGSYAKENASDESDIDIAVISSDITDVFDDMAKLMSLTWGINTRIEPHPIRTEKFKEN